MLYERRGCGECVKVLEEVCVWRSECCVRDEVLEPQLHSFIERHLKFGRQFKFAHFLLVIPELLNEVLVPVLDLFTDQGCYLDALPRFRCHNVLFTV